jgi:hypothetical protein
MLCPYCLRQVPTFKAETDRDGRPLLSCPRPDCAAPGVPLRYVRDYHHFLPVPVNLVGFSGHGKSMFVIGLLQELASLRRDGSWPGFTDEALDEEGIREVRERLRLVAQGMLPERSPFVFPRAQILRLNHVPRLGGCHLLMFDTGGESFRNVSDLRANAHYVCNSRGLVWLLSLDRNDESNSDDDLTDFLTVYQQALHELRMQRKAGYLPSEQELIVVLTKADLLLDRDLPPEALDFLHDDDLDPRTTERTGDSWRRLEVLSGLLKEWMRGQGYGGFVNLADGSFKRVRYCLVSAQGAADRGGGLELQLMPRGVLAPLFWLWRSLVPSLSVRTPAGSQRYFDLAEAVEEAPPEAVIDLELGSYRVGRPLTVTKPLTLRGVGKEQTCVRGGGRGPVLRVDLPEGEEFRAEGVFFYHDEGQPGDAVRVERGRAEFRGCLFAEAVGDGAEAGAGLAVHGSARALVLDCEARNNQGPGVLAADEAEILIAGLLCRRNRGDGVRLDHRALAALMGTRCEKNKGGRGIAVAATARPVLLRGHRGQPVKDERPWQARLAAWFRRTPLWMQAELWRAERNGSVDS